MFTNLKPYPDYRESGSRVLGLVPSGWNVRPMRTLLTTRTGRNRPDLPLLSVARERGAFVRGANDDNHNVIPEDLTGYKIALVGDLVINKMKAWQGSLGLAPCDGIVSPAYYVFEFAMSNRYFGQALLRSRPYVGEFAAASDGVRIGQWDLSVSRLRKVPVVVPPSDEQAAIVKYLGHANARIDRAIAAKRRLIALLEEQKRAIINQAVTRGLDPNVSMKDSGVPWIGDIPTHWDVIPMGAAALMIQTGPFGSQLHAEEYVDGGVPVINPSHLSGTGIAADRAVSVSRTKAGELARHRMTDGDLIAARRGELGRCAVVGQREVGWICGTGSLIIRLRPEAFCPSYFQLFFSSQQTKAQLEAGSVGATMSNLNAQIVARLRIPKPVLEEQRVIVDAVNSEVENAARRIAAVTHEIELLREFRTRLTADVVTGQIDIRDVAARLPELDPDDLVSDGEPDEDDLDADLAESLEQVDG